MTRSEALVIGLTASALVAGYSRVHGHAVPPRFVTAFVTTGDVVRRVAATGTLESVTTAEVGSQVSGTISELGADFNSIVRKGQVIARLEPSLFDAAVASARSAVAKASADVQTAQVAVGDAQVKLKQETALHDRQLVPDSDFDDARVTLETAQANLDAARAQEAQARAALDQAVVDRGHTVITAPIDGIVIARDVDVGQTVAASYQAPTLFTIAADLRRMQVNADIDESDVGMLRVGQPVTFTVDAYPEDEFHGVVKQIRLQPVVAQNVVTYSTLVDVDNGDLRLKPGMTATLNVEVLRSLGVLRAPAAALKYIPRKDDFAALDQPVPAEWNDETAGQRASASGAGFLWAFGDGHLTPVKVTQGLVDGSLVEVRGAGLRPDLPVVTSEILTPVVYGRTPLVQHPGMRR